MRHSQHDEATTVAIRPHRPGPLGLVHVRQLRWHPVFRVLWWMFLLPLAVFAWSSWRLRGVPRALGYVVAGVLLLFGVAAFSAPAPPPSAAAVSAPLIASAAPPTFTTTSPSPSAPAPAPVAMPAVAAPSSPPVIRTTTPRPVYTAPAAPRRTAVIPGSGSTSGTYTNVDGNQVQRPVAAASQPAGATAKCKDGTWSSSQHRSGTCSGHGGVSSWV